MNGLLKVLMGLGLAALVVLVFAIGIAQTHPPRSNLATLPRHHVQFKAPPGAPAPSAQRYDAALCTSGKDCRPGILYLLDTVRRAHGRSGLILDHAQSAGTATCPGAQGHARAMARTGTVWHRDSRYRAATYPRDICVSAAHHAEIDVMSSGTSWSELQAAITGLPRGSKAQRHLLSARFTRAGIGVVKRGAHYFITVDLLGR